MELKNILKNGTEFKEQVYMLYEEAFPAEEKKPISLMEHLEEKGQMELFAVTDQDEFVGLAFNMMDGNTVLLDYFAVSPEKRNGGIWEGARSFYWNDSAVINIFLKSKCRMKKQRMLRTESAGKPSI